MISSSLSTKGVTPVKAVCALAVTFFLVQLLFLQPITGTTKTTALCTTTNADLNETNSQRDDPNEQRKDVCFVTYEFAPPGKFLEPLANLTQLGLRLKDNSSGTETTYRYLAFTNDVTCDTGDWEKIIVPPQDKLYTRPKTMVTRFKFVAWQHPATSSCRTIFSMDGTFFPVNRPEVWEEMEKRVHSSPGGLLIQLKEHNRTVLHLMSLLVGMKKDTQQNIDQTMQWLLSRPDFHNETPCLLANFLGYDPTSPLYREVSGKFWSYYSTEMLTVRDQPLFSYFIMSNEDRLQPAWLYHHGFEGTDRMEKRPHVNLCAAAKRIRKKLEGKPLSDKSQRGEYEVEFDHTMVKEICEASVPHEMTGTRTFGGM